MTLGRTWIGFRLFVWGCVALSASSVWGQVEFERAPINYGKGRTTDPVADLQGKIDSGEVRLEYDAEHGYLPSLLRALDVPASSQVLVHSKTSFQLRRISPKHPRALYFNDETYVGWVQQGDVIELMSTDPWQGEIFYTLDQEEQDKPRFIRDRGQCISCHASSRTQGVPGGLIRSAFVDRGGQPQYGAGTFTTDHSSPFEERWGGWYVSGTHGKMRHMGNVFSQSKQDPESLDREPGANVTDLSELFDVSRYLTPHSDVVALMVLEHQTQMQNYLTLASYEARSAAHHDGIMNAALERPSSYVSETAERRVAAVGDKLLRYMLFVDEFQLTDPVAGTSEFTEEFAAQGPRDSRGRSLRDFDLQKRLFKYPCSYLIYSPSFDKLPDAVRTYVARRLREVLLGEDESEEFAHLSRSDRTAIYQILQETKPDLWAE
ncbi:hypothetical protein [Candidatus Laterigemmans baculatus]|uniref:hypothetical protein n=1 Tax=Candidatus Laterigemmans baculatus TaxID=2770505 RepID=UPI00193BE660|nr:hypothetical protein [Candidatus Laterigemmans baculatus]